jgi:hypothetical protein
MEDLKLLGVSFAIWDRWAESFNCEDVGLNIYKKR